MSGASAEAARGGRAIRAACGAERTAPAAMLRRMTDPDPFTRRVARPGLLALCERIERSAGRSTYTAEGAVFELADETIGVVPPFPIERWQSHERIEVAPLRELLERERTVACLIVRVGGFGAGIYRDAALVEGRHGTRFVKNRHKKGGSSSNRFRRRREEQARDLYDRAAILADAVLRPYAAGIDHLVLTGDRLGIDEVVGRSRLLRGLREHEIPFAEHVPEVRRSVLEALGRELWSSTVVHAPTAR